MPAEPGQGVFINDGVWNSLPGGLLRFMLRLVATLRIQLGAGSGLSITGLFALSDHSAVGTFLAHTSRRNNACDIEIVPCGDSFLL